MISKCEKIDCQGLPPLSCAAFGPNYQPKNDDPYKCAATYKCLTLMATPLLPWPRPTSRAT